MKDFDLENLKGRINPQYSNTIGTESYERRLCVDEIESLRQQLAEANAKVIFCEDRMIRLESKIADLTARLEAQEASEPVATICMPDPDDERDGVRFNLKDWEKLNALPAGTKLYTTPQPTPTVQAAVAAAIRKAAEVCQIVMQAKFEGGTAYDALEAILAIPHDDSALREFGVKIARATYSAVPKSRMQTFQEWAEAIVDRVLGEKK